MIKTAIFDVDNTLYDYDAVHAVAFQALTEYAVRELDVSAAQFRTLHSSASTLLQRHTRTECAANHNRLIRYQILLELLGKPISHAPRMERLYWTTLIDASVPSPGAVECLTQLKRSGVRLGIGTDMTADWQYEKLEHLKLLELLDFLVSSEEAAAEKPAEPFFRLCLEKAGCPAGQCVFVGDSLKKDVQGALRAGMRPVWYHPQGEDAPAPCAEFLTIRRLDELPSLLL